jgi:hypothetical protein
VKALSLRQPWAWLVVHGPKRIENRRWNTRFRGAFLVHAAKGMTRSEYEDARYFAAIVAPKLDVPKFEALQRGGIVGRARLVSVEPPCLLSNDRYPCAHPWHMPEQYGFLLEDVAPVPFRELRGELGFFEVRS